MSARSSRSRKPVWGARVGRTSMRVAALRPLSIVFVLAGTLLLVNYDRLLWRLFVGSLLIGIGVLSN